jgi:putative peptidoglycan lipid II flippase
VAQLVRDNGASARQLAAPAREDTTTSHGMAGLVADSGRMVVWTLVSRITGFGRIVTIAAVLGPTYFANLYQTLLLLPSMLFALLGGSLVGATLVPSLVSWVDSRDTLTVRRVAGGFLGVVVSLLVIVVILSVAATPLLLSLVTAAIADPYVRAQQQHLGWPLMAMLMPQMLLYCVAWTGIAVQHAHGRFAIPAAAPVIENVGVMATMAASAMLFGIGTDLEDVTTPQLLLLGMGATIAVAMHAAVQWWGAYRVGVPLRPRPGWRNPEVRRIIRMLFTSSGYTGLYDIVTFGLLVVAGRIPGAVVAFQIGQMLSYLPVTLCALPLSAAQLPRLSRSYNQENLADFQITYRNSLALSLFVAFPAGLLMFAISETLARVVALGEMATVAGVAIIAASIGSLGPGLIGDASLSISTSASYARRDASAPMRAIAMRAGIAFAGMALALSAMNGIAILWMLCLSVSAANLISAAYLYRHITRAMPPMPRPGRPPVLGALLASTASVVPGAFFAVAVQGPVEHRYQNIAAALGAVAVTGIVYIALQWLRGSAELKALRSAIRGTHFGRWSARQNARTSSSVENEETPDKVAYYGRITQAPNAD